MLTTWKMGWSATIKHKEIKNWGPDGPQFSLTSRERIIHITRSNFMHKSYFFDDLYNSWRCHSNHQELLLQRFFRACQSKRNSSISNWRIKFCSRCRPWNTTRPCWSSIQYVFPAGVSAMRSPKASCPWDLWLSWYPNLSFTVFATLHDEHLLQ